MALNIRPSKFPNLPAAVPAYAISYQDQLNNILRLYANSVDNALYAIITLLANGGYFDELNAGVVNAGTVNASQFNGGNIQAVLAALYNIQANNGAITNLISTDIVAQNITGSRINSSLFTGLGAQITLPHIGASDTTDQYAGGNDTPTKVAWNTLDTSFGFTLSSGNAIATYDGVYKIDYSLQFVNTENAQHDVFVWLQVNGSDVAGSTTQFTVPARKSAGVYGYLCAYSTVPFNISAGDSIALYWATSTAYNPVGPVDGIYMEYVAAQTVPYARPNIPSAIGAITYMSAPDPSLIKIVPIGVFGVAEIGEVTIVIR